MGAIEVLLIFSLIVGSLSLETSNTDSRGRYIITLKNEVSVDSFLDGLEHSLESTLKIHRRYRTVLNGFTADLSGPAVQLLRELPEVSYIEEDSVFSASQGGVPWGLDRIDQLSLPLDGAYQPIGNGDNVTVYVIDSGIYPDHSDFEGRATIAYDALQPGNGNDCNGHGSHVAGVVGGATYGVAKATSLKGVRVLDCDGNGYTSEIVDGLDWVAINAVLPAVVAMSLNGGVSETLDAAVEELVSAGITVICAAGNNIEDACFHSPGRSDKVITVAAVDDSDTRAYFSNHGTCIDLFAPGVNIPSVWIGNTDSTNTISGTSVAAPHVAGAAAILLSDKSDLTPAELKSALISRAVSGVVLDGGLGTPDKLLYVGPGDGPNTPPPSLACSQFITEDGTVVKSPNFPGNYGNNEDCEHLITAPDGVLIVLTFDTFSIEEGSTCQYDSLEIYDYDSAMSSYKIGSFCGDSPPGALTSTGNNMYMRFTSDSDVTAQGFRATVTFQTLSGVCSCPGTCDVSTREFTSPNFPSLYGNNNYCTYHFSADGGAILTLTWLDFNVEPSSIGCSYDSVSIYDGSDDAAPLIAELCGTSLPDPVSSSGSDIYVVFETDSSVLRSGFRATYATSIPLPTGNCTCDGTCDFETSLFNSPNYPNNYEDNSLCEYLFTVTPGKVVAVTWMALDLERTILGCFDSITAYDGADNSAPLIGEFCGTDLPDPVYSSGNAIYLVFESDISGTRSGFQASYKSVQPPSPSPPLSTQAWTSHPPNPVSGGPTTVVTTQSPPGSLCDNNYVDESYPVTSPNYPGLYPRNSDCRNSITAPQGQRVEFTFQAMDIEFDDDCAFDSVQLFDDLAGTQNLTAPLCGSTVPPNPYTSTSNTMYIYFQSDFSVQGTGFSGTFRFV